MRLFGRRPRVAADGKIVSRAVVMHDGGLELLAIIGAQNVAEVEDEVTQRLAFGYAPGRIVDDGHGSLRRKSYASAFEAGVDARIARVEDRGEVDAAARASKLQPLARRIVLLRDYRALSDLEPTKNAQQASESPDNLGPALGPAPGPWPEIDAAFDGADPFLANILGLRLQRAAVERANRDAKIAHFEERQLDAQREISRPDPGSDPSSERARIEVALRRWNDEHAELVDELVREVARGR